MAEWTGQRLRHVHPIPSCTEEKYVCVSTAGHGRFIHRVALIPGLRTTETLINLDDFPVYAAVDDAQFVLTANTVKGLMEHLSNEKVSYLRLVLVHAFMHHSITPCRVPDGFVCAFVC